MSVCCTDADDDAEGLAFNGVNGSGWAQETHPFSSPSYGRVSEGRVDYPRSARAGPTVLHWTGCQWTDLERPHQLAFSPDGATLAVAPDTVVLWNITDRASPKRLSVPLVGQGKIRLVAFSPGGRTLVTSGGGTARRHNYGT